MIEDSESLSMIEVVEYVKKKENDSFDLIGFIKKFNKLSAKEAKEMRKKVTELELIKIKQEHISKIIDLMPENNQDLNKIFVDIGLEEDESEKILKIIKEFK